jgi:hypothetical protein
MMQKHGLNVATKIFYYRILEGIVGDIEIDYISHKTIEGIVVSVGTKVLGILLSAGHISIKSPESNMQEDIESMSWPGERIDMSN